MRRFIKNRILEQIENLLKKHSILEAALLRKEESDVSVLFAACQETAILIGNTIEADEVSHKSAIKKLEIYCEAVYRQSVGLEEFARQRLDDYVLFVRDYVKNQIAEKLEVVFFPYKASMWDSLESVWMAAEKDASCTAYVVPVPYFDKNPDGTVVAMHYEGDEFPEYVPVVNWKDYDVKSRRPDVIYIHNPYDNGNKVTTVHPDFYAKALKQYTDMLVYIPYFVCVNDMIPAHLCVLPGILYADRVIVQSEKAREIYLREFQKFEEEYQCRGAFGNAEEKFLALGSPKYDAVFRAMTEEVKLPEDWSRKIIKEDGSKKKVLLYNTSVSQLLAGREELLEKIQSVFAQMKDREDVILLWRPHPLSETTCEAMRPELLEAYDTMVKTYRTEDWGIYDDTPDLHRAIAVSDAYYGDMSSLVELYRVTGKPVMIQNLDVV